jgi:hypothetical protein
MPNRILLVLAATVSAVVWSTTAASGAGPTPGVIQGVVGLEAGNARYIAVPAGSTTMLDVERRSDARVLRQMSIKGNWGIPLVAYDRTVEGLLAGGRTLVLAQDIYAGDGTLRKSTRLKLVDVRRMRVTRDIHLRGAFSYDAASPDGHYLYLIEFFTAEDPNLYRVRAYELRTGHLLAKIVSDRRSWQTGMQGMPISRTWKDGSAFTLYGGNARPFIHALDTRGLAAVCIDLPWRTSPDGIFDYRLRTDAHGHLVVRGPHGRALVVIDRRSFKILSAVENP